MVEVTMEGIRRCCHSGQPVLILKEKSGGYLVPLRLPAEDAQVLVGELTGVQTRESYAYFLLVSVLDHLGGKITAVVLHLESNGVLESCLRVEGARGHRQVTAHPIDALALGLRQGSPIFLNADTLEKIGFPVSQCSEQPDCDEGTEAGAPRADNHHDDSLPPAVRDFLSTLDLSGLRSSADETGR